MAFWNKKKGPVMAGKRRKPDSEPVQDTASAAAPPGFVYDPATDRYIRIEARQGGVPQQQSAWTGAPAASFGFDEDPDGPEPHSPPPTPIPTAPARELQNPAPPVVPPQPPYNPAPPAPIEYRLVSAVPETPASSVLEPPAQPVQKALEPTVKKTKKPPSASKGGREETEDTKDPFRPPAQATQTALALSWAASAASFRGTVIFLLSICLTVVCLAFAVFVLVHQDVVFLSIDDDARPTYITAEMGAVPSHETMVRDFIYNGFIGDASNIKNNVERAQAMMTQTASALFYEKYWKALIQNMESNGLVQSMVIQSIETTDMKPDKFTVKAVCVRQYSNFKTRIQTSKSFLTLEIVKTGVYTKQNPWGMSVDGIEYTGE